MKNCSVRKVDRDILEKELFRNREIKKILDEVKKVTYREFTDILMEMDRELVKGALAGEHFQELFFANCKCEKIAACVKEILA